ARIARRTEKEQLKRVTEGFSKSHTIPNAISQAVGQISSQLRAAAIMTLTRTGATARNVSKFRPKAPILAITPMVDVSRQLQLVWGVNPLLVMDSGSTGQTFQAAMNVAQEKQLLHDGDLVVMTAGTLQGVSGSTDLIKVEMVTAVIGQGQGIGEGSVSGRARIAHDTAAIKDFNAGEILVVPRTSADYVDAIRRAGGIVTEDDSLTSHAAVLGLRLGIPVIVGVEKATEIIRNGTIVTLDVSKGVVCSGTFNSPQEEVALV
ncbi:MAG: pyruvate kinase alpha/beta domain-containing protein, partial [Cyanobacteria bacterium P01_A01_bin.116]